MSTLPLILAALGYQFPFTHVNVCKGYGDWNGIVEFHTGLDFRCGENEWAFNPYWDTQTPAYVLESYGPDPLGGWIVFMVPDLNDETGWAYEHMLESTPGMYDRDSIPGQPSFTSTIGRCQDHDRGRHLHMCWMDETNWGTPPPGYVNPQPGYFNLFDELPTPPGYDTALFDTVHTYLMSTPDSILEVLGRGLLFTLDGEEVPSQFPGFPDSLTAFQEHIWGVVDAIVKPISAYQGLATNDSCGVRALSFQLYRQNHYPVTPEWEPAQPVYYGIRELFNMTGFIPDDGDTSVYTPEFEAVFWDGYPCVLPGEGHFDNNYILTNCGTMPFVPDVSCLANVWTEDYDAEEDFSDEEYCRGAWDTRLWNPDVSNPPSDYMAGDMSQALFPDGRYAFRVTAESQGSRDTSTAWLPTDDLSDPALTNLRGVIVDNFAPAVLSVIVYVTPSFDILYSGNWTTEQSTRSGYHRMLSSEDLGYPRLLMQSLGVAVRYSEPVLEAQANDIGLSIVCGSDTLWDSSVSRSDWFAPCDWESQLGDSLLDSLGYWQCYSSSSSSSYLQAYYGRCLISIGELNESGQLPGPADLAGNPFDADPSTIAARDPDTGAWTTACYEQGIDQTNSWAIASGYELAQRNLVVGNAGGDSVGVTLSQELYSAILHGDCTRLCGFWMGKQSNSEHYIREYAIRPNGPQPGLVETFEIPTLYQVGGCSDPPQPGEAWSYLAFGGAGLPGFPVVSGNGDIWLAVQNEVFFPESLWSGDCIGSVIGHVVCVDPEDGVLLDFEVFDGGRFAAPPRIWHGCSFTSMHLLGNSTDSVMVCFGIAGPYPKFDLDSMVVSLDGALGRQGAATSAEVVPPAPAAGAVLRLSDNPCHGQLSLSITCRSAASVPVQLFDLAGRVVLEQQVVLTRGDNRISLPTGHLPNGVYQLRAVLPEETVIRTVVLLP